MKAAFIQQPGPPTNITYGELPTPEPKPTEALVRVGAVAVNPIDTYLRAGAIKMNLPSPYVIGCDLAGTVEKVGAGVKRFKPGDRVWGSNQGLLGRQGTFAEYAAVDEQWLYPMPDKTSFEQAAAIALVGITAHLGLVQHARLKSGETRKVSVDCRATIGEIGNDEHNLRSFGKAGAKRWRGIRPTVRGVAMNPVDHPHGGGEGKTSGGRHPVTPWGVPTKGHKTRNNKRTDRFIVRRRGQK